MPWEFSELDKHKKASLIAMISIYIKQENKEANKLKARK